jgi:hypothetical protein
MYERIYVKNMPNFSPPSKVVFSATQKSIAPESSNDIYY